MNRNFLNVFFVFSSSAFPSTIFAQKKKNTYNFIFHEENYPRWIFSWNTRAYKIMKTISISKIIKPNYKSKHWTM